MSKLSNWLCKLACVAATFVLASGAVQAQTQTAKDYPNRLIKVVVPYPAGGATDTVGRLIGTRLADAWGQPVVVENRVGASGNIGGDFVAKSPADGYTILVGITAMIQAPFLYTRMPYDAFTAFAPVSLLARSADLFVVSTSVPANTLKEFVALVKANPKKYNYGSYGNATSSHLHGEMLNAQAGLDMVHVPFKGAAPLVNDLLGGQITAAFVDVASVRGHLKSGKFKTLAVTGEQRFKILPEVPTFTELGYKSYEPYGWFGVFVPANTSKDIVNKLSTEIARIVRLPDVAQRIDDLGLQAAGTNAEEFAATMKADAPVWGKVIKDANIKLD
ncbi:MAG: Bug family tripartite tricarboxylate transporter substrate binding protein [Noviherbaspirillum sp.]